MAKYYLTIILFCIGNVSVYTQSLNWAKTTTGDIVPTSDIPIIPTEKGIHNLLDHSDNYYNFGTLNGTADLNPGPGIFNVTLNPTDNFYIQKLDKDGNFIWGLGYNNAQFIDAVIGTDNSIIIAGSFFDTIDLDLSSGTFILDALSYDHFILKLDSAGNFISGFLLGDDTSNEMIHSICVDNSNNLWILGKIDGNSGDLDPGVGITTLNSSWSELLLMKLNPNNDLIWAYNSSGKNGIQIECGIDNQPVMYGQFWSSEYFDFFSFSNDMTATNNNMFFWKVDENANFVWSYTLDYGYAEVSDFVIDNLNSIYFTGIFNDSLDFDPSINTEVVTGSNKMFIQKVDQNANLEWYSVFGSGNPVLPNSITIDSSYNVYPSGLFVGTNNFSNTITPDFHNSFGNTDYFILKLDEAGNSIWAISSGDSDNDFINSVVADKSGNLYATGSIFGNMDVDPEGSVYTLSTLFADAFNLKLASSRPSICMVTVDSLSIHNIIYWDKSIMNNIDSIYIYRETLTNNYNWIGTVSFDSAGLFIDTVSQLYFPFTGNPNSGTYRYKIQTLDIWGNLSQMSPYHNTIFATNNFGTFEWNPYLIEGSSSPIPQLGAYLLYRDDNSTGNWNVVSAVAGTQTTITDPDYFNYPNGKWRVLTDWSISCDPERVGINTSRSNIKNTPLASNGISENFTSKISVFPNPASDEITILNEMSNFEICTLSVLNITGKIIYSQELKSNSEIIQLDEMAPGIYILNISSSKGNYLEKLVINN